MDIKVVCDDEKYLPQYANDTDACMDLKVVVPKGEFVLCPGHSKVFQTGIKVSVPENHVMMMFLRSSAGIKGKLTLMNGTGIIDSGYRDEVKLAIKNNSDNQSYIFKDGDSKNMVVHGFSLRDYDFLGVSRKYIFKKIYNSGAMIIDDHNKIPWELKSCLNNRNYVIPCLF
jgi:dUTP pyrophosphatase